MSRKQPIKTLTVLLVIGAIVVAVMTYNYMTYDPGTRRRSAPVVADAARPAEPGIEELMRKGRQPYAELCAPCHKMDGKGLTGTYPALDGSKVVRGPRAAHIEVALNGRPGTAMPAFKDRLSDAELAAILTFERNAWVFKTFDAVQAAEVAAVRARFAARER